MGAISERKQSNKKFSLRSFASVMLGFFLIVFLLVAFVVVPKINETFDSKNAEDILVDMALEAKLFTNYVETQRSVLQDLAQSPSLVNAAMLSDASNPALLDFIDNTVVGGEKGSLILQDIAGSVVIQTASEIQGSYLEDEAWITMILDGMAPYHFQLLSQSDGFFSFKISIPVKYNGSVEGVLSAEITASLDQVFVSQTFDKRIAFKLVQNQVTVATDSDHIEIAHEQSLELELPTLTFVYITDDAVSLRREGSFRKTILIVLFIGLTGSFLLLASYGYFTQVGNAYANEPRSVVRRVYLIPVVVAATGAVASAIAFAVVLDFQRSSIEREKNAVAIEYIATVKEKIYTKLDILKSIAAFYYASSNVDRQEFSTFTQYYTIGSSDIQALAWIPNVLSDERETYEKMAKVDGFDDFEFKEINAENRLQTAKIRDRYFPVYFVMPMRGNEKVLGFDLGSSQRRLSALSIARERGSAVATEPLELVEESVSTTGILVFYPIYRDIEIVSAPISSGSDRPLKGFAQLLLKTDNILVESVRRNNGIRSTHVQDITNSENYQNVYGIEIPVDELTYSQSFDVAGRTWRVATSTTLTSTHMQWMPWLILVSGFVLTAFITTSLVHLIRRREVVEQTVKERTADLNMLSSIAANSNDMLVVTDAKRMDDGGGAILYVNDAFTRHTGFGFNEAVGETLDVLQGVNTDSNQIDLIKQAKLQGKVYQGELLSYTKEGGEFWADMSVSPIRDENEDIIQFAVVLRDISDRIKYRDERENLIDSLTDSNEELARFAFVCSHDLQEPLRMIRSFSEKLQTHISDDLVDDEKGQKYFRFITEGAARAQELIADILAYSSISSDTQKLGYSDGNQLIENVKETLNATLQGGGGCITSDDIPELFGNKTQLYQLFQNIINNALKYRRSGLAPEVHIGVADMGLYLQFAISDNGIGMEQRHLAKIFDVFQRLHRRSQYAGTGIGLSICKKVVERHGGTIWAESELDVGTTFYFTLPKPSNKEPVNEKQRKVG